MNGYERLIAVMDGTTPDQVPLMPITMMFAADLAGIPYGEYCQDGEKCLTHELWADLSKQLYEFLDGITLGQMVQWPAVQKVAERQEARHPRGLQNTKTVA